MWCRGALPVCTRKLHLLEVHKQICFVERNGSLLTASARCFQRVWQEQGFAESDAFEKDASLQRKNEKFVSVQLMNLLTFLGFHSRCNSRHGVWQEAPAGWELCRTYLCCRHCPAWLEPPAPSWVGVSEAAPMVPARAP